MDQSRFWNLLAKKIAGETSPEEIKELEILIRSNPDWAYQAEHLHHLWQHPPAQVANESENAFQQHVNRMKESGIYFPELDRPGTISSLQFSRWNPRKKLMAFSAATLVIAVVAVLVWLNHPTQTVAATTKKPYSEISSPLKSRTKLVLPDSSVVWLNAGSKLTYNAGFGTINRHTVLVGEAYFEVKKSDVPFIIRANDLTIKVLGTAFNVKAYPGERTTETSLVRGRVEVTINKRPAEPIILKPNDKLIVANEEEQLKAKVQKMDPIVVIRTLTHVNDTTIAETSWVDNKLIFQDEAFTDIARKMERWYGVVIEFNNESVASERLSGTFTSESIQEALNALQLTTPFYYYTKGNKITIAQ